MTCPVAVILPTHNRAHVLARAVESVLAQSFADFALIVVDDGSTDETSDLLHNYHDERLRIITHQHNRGVAAARNTGVIASKGARWLAFIDSDDAWHVDKLARQMAVAQAMGEGETAVFYTALTRHQNGNKSRFPQRGANGFVHNALLGGNLVAASTALVRSDCFGRKELFDEGLTCLVDWELWLRLSRFYRFYFVNEPLVTAHHLPDGVSGDDTAVLQALQYIVNKHEPSFGQDKRIVAHYYYLIGNHLCLREQMRSGRSYLERAVKAAPYQPRYRLAQTVSVLGERVYHRCQSLLNRL